MALSKSQIDRLGERLKAGSTSEDDFRLLDELRRSFDVAYLAVIQKIGNSGELRQSRIKTRTSIVEKLRREKTMKLSRIQDIAGCRVVVANVVQQNVLVSSLITNFPGAHAIDRRDKPSHGYQAVHVVVQVAGKSVEIQVRTSLQHYWAVVSEKSSDVLDPAIKHGAGPEWWRTSLTDMSESIAACEKKELFATYLDKLDPGEIMRELAAAAVSTTPGAYDEKTSEVAKRVAMAVELAKSMPKDWVQEYEKRGKQIPDFDLMQKVQEAVANERNKLADCLKSMIRSLDDLRG